MVIWANLSWAVVKRTLSQNLFFAGSPNMEWDESKEHPVPSWPHQMLFPHQGQHITVLFFFDSTQCSTVRKVCSFNCPLKQSRSVWTSWVISFYSSQSPTEVIQAKGNVNTKQSESSLLLGNLQAVSSRLSSEGCTSRCSPACPSSSPDSWIVRRKTSAVDLLSDWAQISSFDLFSNPSLPWCFLSLLIETTRWYHFVTADAPCILFSLPRVLASSLFWGIKCEMSTTELCVWSLGPQMFECFGRL